MGCKCATFDSDTGRYDCSVSGDGCMFLIQNSKACAEKYGEGPDVVTEQQYKEDDYIKYECNDCERQFIVGKKSTESCPPGYPVCPYCGRSNVEGIVESEAEYEDLGCMSILLKLEGKE